MLINYKTVSYSFRRSNLRWRLVKRQTKFDGKTPIRYKRPEGTRWVEHQRAAINSHLNNITIIGLCKQQIESPYNRTMKALDSQLHGMKKKVTITKNILFDSIKFDLLVIVQQVSKVLQEEDLLLPSLFSICSRGLKT